MGLEIKGLSAQAVLCEYRRVVSEYNRLRRYYEDLVAEAGHAGKGMHTAARQADCLKKLLDSYGIDPEEVEEEELSPFDEPTGFYPGAGSCAF